MIDPDTCFDFVHNGNESDIDCGGFMCWRRCESGEICNTPFDCESGTCIDGTCVSEIYRSLSASGAAPSPDPDIVYVHMPYEDFNRAIAIIILMFVLPCCCIFSYFCYKYRTMEGFEEFDGGRETQKIQLIPKSPSMRRQVIEETI